MSSDLIQCAKCHKTFAYKSLLLKHMERKRPCVPSTAPIPVAMELGETGQDTGRTGQDTRQDTGRTGQDTGQDTGRTGQDTGRTGQDTCQDTGRTGQDTGLFRTNTKEQYYTKSEIAKFCVTKLLEKIPDINGSTEYIWLEPAAGAGAFINHIPAWVPMENRIAIDIEPAISAAQQLGIQTQDYLKWTVPVQTNTNKKYLVFGNPPFGRQSTLARAFIAKSCKFAAVIGFILPKSFVKPSMNRAFADHFHCIYSEELPSNSFLLNGTKPYDVPCVFQIWQKQASQRAIQQEVEPIGYGYVKPEQQYDIIFRRVGVYAGKAYNPLATPGVKYSEQAHYFINLSAALRPHLNRIVEKINSHTFPSNTVGPRSLSKSEVNAVINQIVQQIAGPAPNWNQ